MRRSPSHRLAFSFPAHTRVASRPKNPALAIATLVDLPATLPSSLFELRRTKDGLEHNRYVPPAMLAAWGSLVKSNVVGVAMSAVPETPSRGKLGTPSAFAKATADKSGMLIQQAGYSIMNQHLILAAALRQAPRRRVVEVAEGHCMQLKKEAERPGKEAGEKQLGAT